MGGLIVPVHLETTTKSMNLAGLVCLDYCLLQDAVLCFSRPFATFWKQPKTGVSTSD